MPPVHPRISLGDWIPRFPVRPDEDAEARSAQAYVVGPKSVAVVEQLRARHGGPAALGPPAPTDVLVWAQGEPEHRAATKIGGLPYRPAGLPWPTGKEGQPSAFVGQICFADSRDLLINPRGKTVDLPGDVLLLFSPEKSGLWDSDDEDPKSLQHEWHPLGLDRLVSPADLPAQPWTASRGGTIAPCHAHLHRSSDHPAFPDDHPFRKLYDPDPFCVFEGGKIGGVPFYARSHDPRPGVFLAALGTINPSDGPYPFVNLPTPPADNPHMSHGDWLQFGDLGALYLFWEPPTLLRRSGRLHWDIKGS